MTSKLVLFCTAAFFLIDTVSSIHAPGFINGVPLRVHLDNILVPDYDDTACPYQTLWFDQKVDQFNVNDTRTYQQRYQLNDQFFKNATDSPVIFLMIGGEGPINPKWVCWTNYTYMEMAQQYNARLIQLEHRFFGESYPVQTKDGLGDMSTPTLKALLSAQQALADLAAFITAHNKQQGWTNPRWVVFGGSYPGSLCAWFRAEYPDLTLGGICSSAPIWAKVDFYEYAEVMETAFIDYSKQHKSNCSDTIKELFLELKAMIYTETGRGILNRYFNITPPLVAGNLTFDWDVTNFQATVFGAFQGIVQYTFDAANNFTNNGYGIDGLCNIIDQPYTAAPVKNLANVFFWAINEQNTGAQINFLDNNYDNSIAPYAQDSYNITDPESQDASALRGWMWLSCGMALGWLQTTENSHSIFNRMIPLQYYLQQCSDLFGDTLTTDYITRKVAEQNLYFGYSWNYNATNVVVPNGLYDPWSSLGCKVERPNQHQFAPTTPGAAHCSDMYPVRAGEPAGLNATRAVIKREVAYYLSLAAPPANGTTGSSFTGSSTTGSTTTSTSSSPALNIFASLLLFVVTFVAFKN